MRLALLTILAILSACGQDPTQVPEVMVKSQSSRGLIELRRLFAEGHVRAATQADIDAYKRIAKQAQPAGAKPLFLPSLIPQFTLILLRPFKVTPEMGMLSTRSIIVPAAVGKNDDPNPLFSYYYMDTGRCNVSGSNCQGAPKIDAAWHARARRLSGMEPDKTALSDGERDDGNWAETGKKKDTPEPRNGPLGQLPLD